ncbi:uncharacterized protein [Nicotiana tomentosiformis]|uniref:uncharacterized protein n=1 Tax=Nicotiana tomentosiformis TaxID=4098 RepID=UPI00388CB723
MVYTESDRDVWEDLKERFDKVDGSRSFGLHQEIVRMTQGTTSVAAYFTKLKEMWVELEALVPLPGHKCDKSREFVAYLQRQKLYQFLMGLNDNYLQDRSQILLMTPLPSLNQAYAMIISDESQKAIETTSISVVLLGIMPTLGPTTMYSKTGYQNQKFRKNNNMYCGHCKMRNHTRENCYKLRGYSKSLSSREKEDQEGSLQWQGEGDWDVSFREDEFSFK